MTYAQEAFGRVAFALTGSRWASELVGAARAERRYRAAAKAHIAALPCSKRGA